MKQTTKLIATSLLAIAMCVSLALGATFALFTSESSVDIVVTSGKVSVAAEVADLSAYSLDDDDLPVVDNAGKFTNDGTFAYADGKLNLDCITPGDGVRFTVNIVNLSTVGIKYQLRVTGKGDAELLSALKCTVNGEAVTLTGLTFASSWQSANVVGGVADAIAPVAVNVELPEEATCQDMECSLTVGVFAVQGNASTSEPDGAGIYSVSDLQTLAQMVNSGNSFVGETVKLMQDIDFNAPQGISAIAYAVPSARANSAWTPIGTSENPFKGTLEGNGYTIRNFTVTANEDSQSVGLFGYVENATIRNVRIEGAVIDASAEGVSDIGVGILAGEANGLTVSGVTVADSTIVLAEANQMLERGGLVGKASGDVTLQNTVSDAVLDNNSTLGYTVKESWNEEGELAEIAYVGDSGDPQDPDSYSNEITDTLFSLNQAISYVFDKIKFTGTSTISLVNNKASLTVTNCYASVDPQLQGGWMYSFIVAPNAANGTGATLYDIENNTIMRNCDSGQVMNEAIFLESAVADGTVIAGNTFGSEEMPYETEAAVKIINFADGANVRIADNTVYCCTPKTTAEGGHQNYGGHFSAFDLFQQNNMTPTYTVVLDGNKVYGQQKDGQSGTYSFLAFSANANYAKEGSPAHGRVYVTSNNTLDDVVVDEHAFDQRNFATPYQYSFIGWNVSLDDSGKIESGIFFLGKGFDAAQLFELAVADYNADLIRFYDPAHPGVYRNSDGDVVVDSAASIQKFVSSGISGTQDKPVLVKLANDITVSSGMARVNASHDWVFDGMGHTITADMSVSSGNVWYLGSGTNSVTLRNFTVQGVARSAIYVNDDSENVTIEKVNITGTYNVATYGYSNACINYVDCNIATNSAWGASLGVGSDGIATLKNCKVDTVCVMNCRMYEARVAQLPSGTGIHAFGKLYVDKDCVIGSYTTSNGAIIFSEGAQIPSCMVASVVVSVSEQSLPGLKLQIESDGPETMYFQNLSDAEELAKYTDDHTVNHLQ